jgi:DNA gyrase/topoisomerase IV subunit A
MKVRDGDGLMVVTTPAKRMAFFSRMGYGLSIAQSEIAAREGASVGIQLFSVRDQDEMVAAIGYERDATVELTLASGGTKELKLSEVVPGKRALKGNKVIARGEIAAVALAGEKK